MKVTIINQDLNISSSPSYELVVYTINLPSSQLSIIFNI